MNALVAYFSQTGNTRKVAEAIARGLEAEGCDPVHVRPIEKVGPGEWRDCDLFVLGTPVFYYKEPANVRAWIRGLAARGPVPAFTFITHGGNPTNTLRRLRRLLRPKGARVLGSFECLGYDTYPIYLKSFRQWGHPDADELAAAAEFGRGAVRLAERFGLGEAVAETSYPFVGGRTFRLSILCQRPILDWTFPRLGLNRDLCTRCGACARRCPTENIALDPWPAFDDRCIRCYLCERVCPHNAIQCDWRFMTRLMNP
jgi:flavodoxin/NAD-dependent dihydropyrimidine dehydrogenase PreA subunit